jgi:hypothetical protein
MASTDPDLINPSLNGNTIEVDAADAVTSSLAPTLCLVSTNLTITALDWAAFLMAGGTQ